MLSETVQRRDEAVRCDERACVLRPERAGQCGERRPQEHHRLRALKRALPAAQVRSPGSRR